MLKIAVMCICVDNCWLYVRMAECSEVEDDVLCKVAGDAEAACNDLDKQSTMIDDQPQPLGHRNISVSESRSEADVYDMSDDLICIYRGNDNCFGDCLVPEYPSKTSVCSASPDVNIDIGAETGDDCEHVGINSCHTDDLDCDIYSNGSEASIPICCFGDFSDELMVLNMISSNNNHPVGDSCVEDNRPHTFNAECLSNTNATAEQAIHNSVIGKVESVANAELADADATSVGKEMGDLCGEKLTAECLADTAAANASTDPDSGNFESAENAAEDECPPAKPAEPVSEKPQSLSFSSDVLLVAPTGKAANVLGRRTGLQAFTMHQVIFSYHAWRRCDKSPRPAWKFDDVRMLVVDECSLVAVTTFHSLISKVLHSLQKVVLLGDVLQLPSIEPGTYLLLLFFL